MNEKPTDRRNAAAAAERLTYDVPEAGRLLGLSRNGAYAAAKAGLIPVLEMGGRKLVPKIALHQMLAAAGADWERAREAAAERSVSGKGEGLTIRQRTASREEPRDWTPPDGVETSVPAANRKR
ncbi:helix-turn-helix domain-containing protein [Bradyrhizobium sp.]|uniref:helix-turn-helix domain-containing protein n=1 Tax=Bradyrhizobium sp. TaxID=376 RepID=UPI0025C59827|nr:helix-turn-helix domain-containing protein [Bradyrhizobium sp.]